MSELLSTQTDGPVSALIVRGDKLAEKLAAAANLDLPDLAEALAKEPRRREMLWFVQWYSMQPGGLPKLTTELLAAFPERLTTKSIADAEAMPRGGMDGPLFANFTRESLRQMKLAEEKGGWSLRQCIHFWDQERPDNEFHYRKQEGELGGAAFNEWSYQVLNEFEIHEGRYGNVTKTLYGSRTLEELLSGKMDPCDALEGVAKFGKNYFLGRVREIAGARLARHLSNMCVDLPTSVAGGPWWFPELERTLLEFMDRHATTARLRLADTGVSLAVLDGMAYACHSHKVVKITGNSRFGKTESAKTFCLMYPGRIRLLSVPVGNGDGPIVIAIAEAVGIPAVNSVRSPALRYRVDLVLRHGGLGFALDESHFLVPHRFTSRTAPDRMNFIRTQIWDRALPCVLISTPQTAPEFTKSLPPGKRKAAAGNLEARYQKATGYTLEQWTERISRTIHLPKSLTEADILSVARLQFPGQSDLALEDICHRALRAGSFLSALANIYGLAEWNSTKRGGRGVLSRRDIVSACDELYPTAADPTPEADDDGAEIQSPPRLPPGLSRLPCSAQRGQAAEVLQAGGGGRASRPAAPAAPERVGATGTGRIPTLV